MLRSNLATRPFYNQRAVRIGIAILVLLVTALTAYNVLQAAALNARNTEMSQRAEAAERQSAEYRRQAQAIRASLETEEMSLVQQAAREANVLIDRRVFSWTDLFNEFERTLPGDVRIVAVEPQVDIQGRMLVAITVLSRRPEDLSEFMDQLEVSGRFREVLNRQDQPTEDGLMRSVVQGYYDPSGQKPTSPPLEASEPSDTAATEANEPAGAAANRTPGTPQGER